MATNGHYNHDFCCCCSVTKSCPTLCGPMDCSTSDSSVLNHHLDFAQIHVHWASNAIQPSHPLPPLSLSAFSLPQHHGLFQWVSSSYQVAKSLGPQHQSFPWIFRVDLLGLTGLISLLSKGLSRVFSSSTVYKPQFFFFPPIIFISWRLITLQYFSGFCHTLTWISHGFTCVPILNPPPKPQFFST